ncbi:DUF6350 family protein [Leucobacter sp. NPDC077196]|uniref:cell division protein PerM n=1 Tax=Leucobacter sp. NPDC077196 TaxID=3154959 RepID=UPI003420FAAB
MRSLVTAVIAAIEAVAVALAGLAVVAVPAVLVWVITFGLAAEPASVAADVAGVWLLAHFVPLQFSVSAEAALSLGLTPEALSFSLSLAPLGITLISVLLALRAGWRFAGRGGVGAMGVLGGIVGFGAVSLGAAVVAAPLLEWTAMQAAFSAAAVYGGASAVAFLVRAGRDGHPWWEAAVRRILRGLEYLGVRSGAALPHRAADMIRLAAAALALVFGIAAVGFAIAVATGYADVTALTQGLQLDPIGSLTLFLAQLALVPLAIVWSLAWMSGTGFEIGAGSSVTPFETLLGPLPALPMLGVLPEGWGERGAFAPGLLVVAALALGILFARRPGMRRASWPAAVAISLLAAALTGLAVAGISALSRGSMGPDRLASNGPDAWLTGGFIALEVGGGLLIGTIAGRFDVAKIRAALPSAVPSAVPGSGVLHRRHETADTASVHEDDVDFDSAVDEALDIAADRDETDAFATDVSEAATLMPNDQETAAYATEELALTDSGFEPSQAATTETAGSADRAAEALTDELTDEATLVEAYAWDAETPAAEESEDHPKPGRRAGWRWPSRGH